jgi:hypothetical protein
LGWPAGSRGPGSRSLDSTRRSEAQSGRSGELVTGGSQAGVWSLLKGGIQNEGHQNWSKTHRQRSKHWRAPCLETCTRRSEEGQGKRAMLACGPSYFTRAFTGPKFEAEQIKQQLATFLREELGLQLSSEQGSEAPRRVSTLLFRYIKRFVQEA